MDNDNTFFIFVLGLLVGFGFGATYYAVTIDPDGENPGYDRKWSCKKSAMVQIDNHDKDVMKGKTCVAVNK